MKFSVIYSFDAPRNTSVEPLQPPDLKLWQQTEGDEQFKYGYLEGVWTKGKHRKYCAILTREQFDKFVSHCELRADSTETMGSIGAPGFGIGWAPAIAFNSDSREAIMWAYVTPLPKRCKGTERDWQRTKNAVVRIYG